MQAVRLGESCLTWTIGTQMDRATNARVLAAFARARAELIGAEPGVLDIVPAYASIAVYVDPLVADTARVEERMRTILNEATPVEHVAATRSVVLRVRYDGADLAHVARRAGLRTHDVIALHTAPEYTVAMIGFRPHFPYLLGLDARLATPRRAAPRTHVPAGSVAIGGAQTGVYPCDSPGGWHIIGRTDAFETLRTLQPGDAVRFEAAT